MSEEKAADIEAFFTSHSCPIAERVVKQNCEAIRADSDWLKRDSQAIEEWLKAQ